MIHNPNITPCPYCNRDMEMLVESRVNGKVLVHLKCPKHGVISQDILARQLLERQRQPMLGYRRSR